MSVKLYMFYVGGDCGNSNIELHDVRFSIGETAKSCYDDLRHQWWGTPESLHIDSWAEISHADGYDVTLSAQPFEGKEKLYFLNLGGYPDGDFEEAHKNILVVEETQRKAIQKSVRNQTQWRLAHKDSLMELEKAISVSSQVATSGWYVHLAKTNHVKALGFTARYIRLNKASFSK